MKPNGQTVSQILANLPDDRAAAFTKLHEVIVSNLPKGFEAAISYGGLGYVVPHSIYPAGYHCKPSEPLPFAASLRKSIQSIFTIWAFMPSLNCLIGSWPNFLNIVSEN